MLKEDDSDGSLEEALKGMMILASLSILGGEELKSGVLSVGVSAGVTGIDAVVQTSRLQIGQNFLRVVSQLSTQVAWYS